MRKCTFFAISLLVLPLGAEVRAAGVFSSSPILGDADSGISPAKTYTHAVDFGAGGGASGFPKTVDPATTVNGVPFTIGGPTGPEYTTTGAPDYIGTNSWTRSAPSGENTVDDLLGDFYFHNNILTPAVQTLTLTGLAPGTPYVTTFYGAGWEAGTTRVVTVTASDGGSTVFDQNFTGNANPNVLRYAFVAPADTITYTFTPADPRWGFHQYAFTNEVLPEPAAATLTIVAGAFLRRRRGRC